MVVSYKIGKKNSTQLVKSAFKQAYEARKPEKLIFHIDRGANYRSEQDLRIGVAKYMEFYNRKRPHSKLQYKTPQHIEAAFHDKKAVSE